MQRHQDNELLLPLMVFATFFAMRSQTTSMMSTHTMRLIPMPCQWAALLAPYGLAVLALAVTVTASTRLSVTAR